MLRGDLMRQGVLPVKGRRAPTLALLGASYIQRCIPSGANPSFAQNAIWQWAEALMGPRFKLVAADGVGGRAIQGFMNPLQASILPARPDYCIVGGDGFGNALQAAAPNNTADSMMTAWLAVVNTLRARGIVPIVSDCPPNALITSQAIADEFFDVNARVKAFLRANPDVLFVPWSLDSGVTTGSYPTGGTAETEDGTHPEPKMAYAIGGRYAAVMAPLAPPVDLFTLHATDPLNYCTNPMLTGTAGTKGGGATGNVADNWTLSGSGTTAASKATATDIFSDLTWQQVDVTAATADVTLQSAAFTLPASGKGAVVKGADQLYSAIEVQLLSAPTNFRGFQLQLAFGGSSTTSTGFNAGGTLKDFASHPVGQTLTYFVPLVTIPAAATTCRVTLTVKKSAAGNMTCSFKARRAVIRKAL